MRLRAVASALARHWPLTPAGVALVALAAVLLTFGRARIDIVLTLAGIFWLALAAACALAAGTAGVLLHIDLHRRSRPGRPRLEGAEGEAVATGLVLPRRRVPLAAPPRLSAREPLAELRLAATSREFHERLVPLSRALVPHLCRDFVQEDLLGLWRVRGRVCEPRPVRVLPDTGRLTAAELAACLASGDLVPFPFGPSKGDLVDARTYTRSDPARLILWKVYARRRELMVRAPEQARSPERQPLVYLVAAPGDDAAAGAVRLLAETRLLGEGARFAADGSPVPTADLDGALEAACGSAAHRHRSGADLPAALAHPAVDPDDPVLLVVPATGGRFMAALLAIIAGRPERFVVLGAGDAAAHERVRHRLWRFFFRAPRVVGLRWSGMARALEPFIRAGAHVVLADRTSGRLVALSAAPSYPGAAVSA